MMFSQPCPTCGHCPTCGQFKPVTYPDCTYYPPHRIVYKCGDEMIVVVGDVVDVEFEEK